MAATNALHKAHWYFIVSPSGSASNRLGFAPSGTQACLA
jgi:hypothetical protein